MLYLDCEFNGHNGDLISMALVSSVTGREFYEVVPLDKAYYDNWVMANVIPFLNKKSISREEFSKKLRSFLAVHAGEEIIADSPADFRYLLDKLHGMTDGVYEMFNLEITMRFVISGDIVSEVPHNALSDARALKIWHRGQIKAN